MKNDGWNVSSQHKTYGEYVTVWIEGNDVTVIVEKNPATIVLEQTLNVKPTRETADRIGFAFCALIDEIEKAIEQKKDNDARLRKSDIQDDDVENVSKKTDDDEPEFGRHGTDLNSHLHDHKNYDVPA